MGTPISSTSFVQVAPDGAGKKIENTKVTLLDGTDGYRQRVDVPDGVVVGGAVLDEIVAELRAIRVGIALILDLDPADLLKGE